MSIFVASARSRYFSATASSGIFTRHIVGPETKIWIASAPISSARSMAL